MDPARLVRIGLALLAAGNLAWTVMNWVYGNWVNVVTDLAIVAGCLLALAGLADALDGMSLGRWKAGLVVVAVAHFLQNLLNAVDGVSLPDEWVLFAVMAAAVALFVGAVRWQTDGWDAVPLPWLAAGFLGLAVEPLYYGLRYSWSNPWQSGYAPGLWLVAAAGLVAALGFWRARSE